MNCAQVESIRKLVQATLAELGMPDANWSLVNETILVRDRHFAGRRFGFAGIRAVWLADQGIVEFYDENDDLLRVVTVSPDPAGGEEAA
jgi:hypothetical protein